MTAATHETTRPLARVRRASGTLRLRAPFPLERGGEIPACSIAWELHGDDGSPAVVALGGISASRHVTSRDEQDRPGWWEQIVGRGRALDTNRFRVLCIDWIGGAGDSSGPRASTPFPAVDTHDQARAIAEVLDHLGVPCAHAIIGASYGGMVALAFAELFGDRLERAVVIGAAHRSHPLATGVRAIQRLIVSLGIDTGRATDALRIARSLAMTTYRTAREFEERFDMTPVADTCGAVRFPVQDYLDHHGARFAEVFPPESFLRLSESIDLHCVEPERIDVPVTLVCVKDDALAPPWQMRELAERLPSCSRYIEFDSVYGHDAFLKEVGLISSILTTELQGECTCGGTR